MTDMPLSGLAAAPITLTKFSPAARAVAGTFFAHLPKNSYVVFNTKIPKEFARLGLAELVKLKVLRSVIVEHGAKYQILEDCTGFIKFRKDPADLLQDIPRKRRA